MIAPSTSTHAPSVVSNRSDEDQRIVVHGVAWDTYVLLRDRLNGPGLRMTFLDGALELMSPSRTHETWKKTIARLVETFALERDVPLYGYGSTTFRQELKKGGLEPDECYVVGRELDEVPDIAIEVVVTSGGLDRLAVYERLGVREVWFFERGVFHLHRLGAAGYEPIARSELVPELDFEVLAAYATRTDQHEAVRDFRDRLRATR